jgi:hypothetical protein
MAPLAYEPPVTAACSCAKVVTPVSFKADLVGGLVEIGDGELALGRRREAKDVCTHTAREGVVTATHQGVVTATAGDVLAEVVAVDAGGARAVHTDIAGAGHQGGFDVLDHQRFVGAELGQVQGKHLLAFGFACIKEDLVLGHTGRLRGRAAHQGEGVVAFGATTVVVSGALEPGLVLPRKSIRRTEMSLPPPREPSRSSTAPVSDCCCWPASEFGSTLGEK